MNNGALTTTSFALLNLLSLRSWTTYELAKQMKRNYHWFWPRAESKLYEEPKKLVELGLATAKSEMVGKRPRTTYTITPAGREALESWLATPGPAGPILEFEAMVRVFAAPNGTLQELRDTLRSIVEEMDRWHEIARAIGDEIVETGGPFPERIHVNALLMGFLWNYHESVLQWASWALRETREWDRMSIEQKRQRAIEIFTHPEFGPHDPMTSLESRAPETENG